METTVVAIKAVLAEESVPVFGIAESTLMENEPEGYRCTDALAAARSILCIGMPFPKGIFHSKPREHETYWRAASIYYRDLDRLLLRIARIIEEKGAVALPVFACFPYDDKGRGDFWGFMSLVKMAEAVGIGKTGKNGLLFNTDYGPRLALGGIVTTAELPTVTWPHKDDTGCPDDCFACQEACPIDAIDRSGKVDRVACVKHSVKSPLFSHLMKTKTFDASEASLIAHVTGVDDHAMYTCIRCVSGCPRC